MKSLQAEDPTEVGSYQLLGRLGSGGFGPVYLARSTRGRTVVLKVASPALAGDSDVRGRLRQELSAARNVTGRHLVPLVDADAEAELPWLASRFVAAPTLEELVARYGPLPEPTVRAFGTGLARALTELHAAGLVHRDLKPSNVLVTDEGPLVIDFGIARAADGERISKTALVVGSPGYMSPELARGKESGPAGDVFSLGTVLAFAATGRQPFGQGTTAALLYHVAHGKPDLKGVPQGLVDTVTACLSRKPDPRPTPAELVREIPPEGLDGAFTGWLPAEAANDLAALVAELPQIPTPEAGPTPAAPSAPATSAAPATTPAAPPSDTVGGSEPTQVLGTPIDPPPPVTGTVAPTDPVAPTGPAPSATSPEPPTLYLGTRRAGSPNGPGTAGPPTAAEPSTAAPPAPALSTAAPNRSRRRALGIAAGVLGVAALGGGAAFLLFGSDDTSQDSAAGGEAPDAAHQPSPEQFTTPPAGVAPDPLWSRTLDGRTLARSRKLLVVDNLVYVPGAPLRALNIRTNKEAWAADGLTSAYGRTGYVTSGDLIFFGGPERDGTLVGLHADSGKEQWRTSLDDGLLAKAPLAANGRNLYVVAESEGASMNEGSTALCAVDLDGSHRQIWHKPQGRKAGSGMSHAALATTDFLVYGDEDDTVTVRDADTGKQLWTTRVAAGATAPTPVVVDDLLLLGGQELRAHHLRTGKELWRHHPRSGEGFRAPVVLGGIGYVFEVGGVLWSFDPQTGKPQYVQTDLDATVGGDELVRKGNTLYVASAQGHGLTAVNSRTGATRWTFRDDGAASDAWHIALAGDRLVARHGTALHCLPAV